MKKLVGYLISVAGIAVMALGFGMINLDLKILKTIGPRYVVVAGIIGIISGVILSLNPKDSKKRKDKPKQSKSEVPIYEGEGKTRKIVGYQKD